jgi:CO/xanthine dehydrogenase Mo-binding subunit
VECGAFARADHLEAELRRAAAALSVYRLGATRFVARALATHSPPAHPAAMVAATVALEGLVDRAAAAGGQEAAAFRKGLLNEAGTARGASALLAKAGREVAARMKSARSAPAAWGMALARAPLRPGSAHAVLVCNEDGSYTISCSPCEHAAAVVAVVETLVAERLEVSVDRVATAHGSPTDSPAAGLAEPWLVLRAAREAADEMARKIRRAPGARGGLVTRGEARAEDAPVPLGAFFARVDLDRETGRIALAELVQALAVSPEDGTLRARAEGDALRGVGAALFEGAGGRAALARIGDLPAPVTLLASARGGAGPLGDAAFVGAMAAVANAVARVTEGAPIHLPFEPERVLLSLPDPGDRG